MTELSQLEVIRANGEIEFFDLDPVKGITNIGRHPDNDVVIDSPGIAPFHLVLAHRERPYHLLVLSEEGETRLGGQLLPSNISREIQNWDTIELDGHAIILVDEGAAVARSGTVIAPPAVSAIPPTEPPAPATVAAAPAGLAALPPDQLDDVVLAELAEHEWIIDVEQTVTCELTIVNGGDIVATFQVHVEGLDEEWVVISPPQVNLNEGERASVTIAITPPRLPSSRAGPHYLAVVVTSPNHPGRRSRRGATLTLNPFYEFAVSELSPKRQTVSWRQRSGEAVIPIVNKGNSPATFHVAGEDEERRCRFEFHVPDEEVSLVGQAEVDVPPGQTLSVPVRIEPLSRRLVGLRGCSYSFTITTSLVDEDQIPRAVMGQMTSRPYMGPLRIALVALILASLIMFIGKPRINSFIVDSEIADAGSGVTLSWSVSPFTTDLRIEGLDEPISGATGEVTVFPKGNAATYKLEADNWLAQFVPFVKSQERSVTVLLIPLSPEIKTFAVDKKKIVRGDEVTVNWSVSNVEELRLSAGNVVEIIPPEEHTGQRVITPNNDALVSLEARNASGVALKSGFVKVAVPFLRVREFNVHPAQITAGQSVTVTWAVSGSESVQIAPLPDVYPPSGSATFWPERTMEFILSASNYEANVRRMQRVTVNPAPTPSPEEIAQAAAERAAVEQAGAAPTIEFFTINPSEVLSGGHTVAQLAWSVTGRITDLQVTSPDAEDLTGLEAQGIIDVVLSKPTVYILTASNDELSASQVVEVKLKEETAKPTPTATPQPLEVVFFKAAGAQGFENRVVFQNQYADVMGHPVYLYEVVQGSTVILSWETQGADLVAVGLGRIADEELEKQAATGSKTLVTTESHFYKLVAQDASTARKVFIELQVIPFVPSSIAVTETASPSSLAEPGGGVNYAARVDNVSTLNNVTLITLTDSIRGNLHGQGSCSVPQFIPAGGFYECTFAISVSGNAGDVVTSTLTATGTDDDGTALVGSDTATVSLSDVPSSIAVIQTANPTSLPQPGGGVTYTVRVDNTSAVDSVTISSLTDSVLGNLHGQGSCAVPQVIAAGGFYQCVFTATVSGSAGAVATSTVTASGTDDDGNPISGSDDATVTITTIATTSSSRVTSGVATIERNAPANLYSERRQDLCLKTRF